MIHNHISTNSISNATGDDVPLAGAGGKLGKIALKTEVDSVQTIVDKLSNKVYHLVSDSGARSFLDLHDVPKEYINGHFVVSTEIGLELIDYKAIREEQDKEIYNKIEECKTEEMSIREVLNLYKLDLVKLQTSLEIAHSNAAITIEDHNKTKEALNQLTLKVDNFESSLQQHTNSLLESLKNTIDLHNKLPEIYLTKESHDNAMLQINGMLEAQNNIVQNINHTAILRDEFVKITVDHDSSIKQINEKISVLNQDKISLFKRFIKGVSSNNNPDLNNEFFGENAGKLNKTGKNNTALGKNSLQDNTQGSDLLAVGTNSLAKHIQGDRIISLGSNALAKHTMGGDIIAIGAECLSDSINNQMIIAIGNKISSPNGVNLILIGNGLISNNKQNSIVIGTNAEATENNQLTIGSSVSTIDKIKLISSDVTEWTTALKFTNDCYAITQPLTDYSDKVATTKFVADYVEKALKRK